MDPLPEKDTRKLASVKADHHFRSCWSNFQASLETKKIRLVQAILWVHTTNISPTTVNWFAQLEHSARLLDFWSLVDPLKLGEDTS